MSTDIRAELSEKNNYYINKHRYYELKHFCLQYPIWKKAYLALDGLSKRPSDLALFNKNEHGDPTSRCVASMLRYSYRMSLVEDAAKKVGGELSEYILKAVTEGLSYEGIKAKFDIPCCREVYYKLYRRFFWELSRTRD